MIEQRRKKSAIFVLTWLIFAGPVTIIVHVVSLHLCIHLWVRSSLNDTYTSFIVCIITQPLLQCTYHIHK